MTSAGISGSRVKVQLTKAGISGSRIGVRDDCTPSRQALRGIGEGIKKEPEGCLFDFLPAHLLRWRLPTLPLAQYHRRDGA